MRGSCIGILQAEWGEERKALGKEGKRRGEKGEEKKGKEAKVK